MNATHPNQEYGKPSSQTGAIQPGKRGRGRPPGSKNKPKVELQEPQQEGWFKVQRTAKVSPPQTKGTILHQKKWQRDLVKPQFVLTRDDTTEIFLQFLKSSAGKKALTDLVFDGFPGIGKLSDASLGKFVEHLGLLSKYPHDVIIKG